MGLPPFQKLYQPGDELFSRSQDNVDTVLRTIQGKQFLITGESALFLEATVTVPSDWTLIADASMTFGWVNFNTATNPQVQYRKTPDGMVELFGVIKSGTVGLSAFTLPTGYRPSLLINPSCTSNAAFGVVTIKADGTVVPAAGSNVYFDFGLFRFAASDRTPVPLSCWPIQIPCMLATEPNGVFIASAVETSSGNYVVSGNPDWTWSTISGQNFINIRNVPFLPPEKTYDLTFLVCGVA